MVAADRTERGQVRKVGLQMGRMPDLGINTMTVSKAYQLLKNEGFLYTDRRLGSIVHIPENEEPSSLFQEKLEDELELLSAEARIRGMNLEDFLSLCSKVFVEMEVAVE